MRTRSTTIPSEPAGWPSASAAQRGRRVRSSVRMREATGRPARSSSSPKKPAVDWIIHERGRESETNVPRPFSRLTSPSCSSRPSAWRMVVRDSP